MNPQYEDCRAGYAGVFDQLGGYGVAPAVVTVDAVNAYTDPQYPFYCQMSDQVVNAIVEVLRMARSRGVPVCHVRSFCSADGQDGAMLLKKAPSLKQFREEAPLAQLDARLEVGRNEPVLVKRGAASAFFGTNLAALLTAQRRDTVILLGFSTSGCIRASAVDAVQHGFHTIVPRAGVGDRHPAPHEANLFDIHAKYGDVVELAPLLSYLHEPRESPEHLTPHNTK